MEALEAILQALGAFKIGEMIGELMGSRIFIYLAMVALTYSAWICGHWLYENF